MDHRIIMLLALISVGLLEQTYGMQIFVHDSKGFKIPVQTQPDETVQILKTKIASVVKDPSNEQSLILEGKLLSDEQTLEENSIHEDSILYLVRGVQPEKGDAIEITVITWTGQPVSIQTNTGNSVRILRAQIESSLGFRATHLVCEGKELDNYDLSLRNYKVESGSTIKLM